MSEKTIHQRSHRQLSMFEDDMNLVPYTSPKKGIGTVERLNDNEIPFTYDRERIEELELTLN